MTRRLRMLISFDGAGYHGWQAGRSGRSVVDVLQEILATLDVLEDVVSSSRTDSGVHAHGLVAHADFAAGTAGRKARQIRDHLNSRLPGSIRIREAAWVSDRFHARFDACWKEYRYRVWNEEVMNPLLTNRAWHVPQRLDLAAMREVAGKLTGEHDFVAFTSRRDGTLGSTVRNLHRCAVSRCGGEVRFTIRGDGFLYKMCRGLVGTLVAVGRGKLRVDDIQGMLRPQATRTSAANAPAEGLVLWKVGYQRPGAIRDFDKPV